MKTWGREIRYGREDFNMPWAIQIQTINVCNRSCYFCPSHKKGFIRKRHKMSFDLYNELLHSLKEWGYKGRIGLYLMNEPLLDKDICRRIELARKILPKCFLYLDSNGDFFDKSIMKRLFKCGLNFITINMYDGVIKYDKMRERVMQFVEHNRIEYTDTESMYSHNKVSTKYIKVLPMYKSPTGTRKRWNRGGNVSKITQRDLELPLEKKCVLPFRGMYITSEGKALLCCSDWGQKVVMGKFPNEPVKKIWNGKLYSVYRNRLYKGDRKHLPLCKDCDYGGGTRQGFLDTVAFEDERNFIKIVRLLCNDNRRKYK